MTYVYVLLALLMLSAIVTVHEFGHFAVGRLTGIAVEEFSIGMGPRLFGRKGKHTLFSVRAIPIGGFCRFKGEDESDASPDAMNSQPVWKRFLTVLAGPAMNVLLAYVLCVILLCCFMYREYLPVIDKVGAQTPAEAAGLLPGDAVTSVNGTPITMDQEGFDTLRAVISRSEPGGDLEITVDRNGTEVTLHSSTQAVKLEDGSTAVQAGIELTGVHYTPFQALGLSFRYMGEVLKLMLDSLRNLVFHGEGLEETMGPVGIISFVSSNMHEGIYTVIYLAFIITLNLALMNLLPLPALDGGRLVFLAVEGIRRKPIPREKEGYVHAAGLVLLLGAVVFFTYKDIVRIITG